MILNNLKSNSGRLNNIIYWTILGIILVMAAYIRVRVLEIPLERDEGEYAYCGQLILQMVPPFKAAYTMKLPGTCFAYSLIMLILGQTIKGIHLGLLCINCLSIILLFLIARKLLNSLAALVASFSYAILSVSPTVLGFAAHATHFIVLAALAGTFLLLLSREKGRLTLLWGSGFLFGLAFIMKQQGVFFVLWGGFLILYMDIRFEPFDIKALVARVLIFAASAILPLILVGVIVLSSGALDRFWFWTVTYSSEYARALSISRGWENFNKNLLEVIEGFALLWIMAPSGFGALMIDKRFKDIRMVLISFVLLSFCAAGAGFYFRNHYFIVLLPAVSLLIASFLDSMQHYISQKCSSKFVISMPLIIFLLAVGWGVNAHRDYFLYEKPETLVKTIHGPNPFLESLKIAEFLRSRTRIGENLAVLGSEPQIFFYANRPAATGYIYTYELMGNHA